MLVLVGRDEVAPAGAITDRARLSSFLPDAATGGRLCIAAYKRGSCRRQAGLPCWKNAWVFGELGAGIASGSPSGGRGGAILDTDSVRGGFEISNKLLEDFLEGFAYVGVDLIGIMTSCEVRAEPKHVCA